MAIEMPYKWNWQKIGRLGALINYVSDHIFSLKWKEVIPYKNQLEIESHVQVGMLIDLGSPYTRSNT